MKLLSKVVWSEGMYLGPHHFQAQNRYFEEAIHFATTSLWKYGYGFSACEVDEDALRNGIVALRHARGIFEDGLAFDIPESDPLPTALPITDRFAPTADHLTISLAVPPWLPGGQNCSLESNGNASSRYVGALEQVQDENTGLDQKPVRIGRKSLRLVLGDDVAEGLLTLPLCRIKRDGTGHFAFDQAFVPPVLQISASTRLSRMLQKLIEILESKSEMITVERQSAAGKFQAGMSPGQVWQFWFLHAINSSLTPLRHLLLSKHGHPEELFCEMSRLAGALCTFGLDVHPRSLPSYDHRAPGEAFTALEEHIQHHLEILLPTQAIIIPLTPGAQYFYNGELKDQRCLGPARWIVGISSNIGEADLISRTLQFVKVCSSKFVPELVKRALPGLTLTHMQVPPSAVSAKVDYQYFMISRNGPCWEHIQQTKQVGVYVPGEIPSPNMELIVLLEG